MLVDVKESDAYPNYVAVIGGGRWARILLEVICSIVPMSVKISAHSPRNAPAMTKWVHSLGLERRIRVFSDYPKSISGQIGAVVVANAAHDHEKAIEWALLERLPVLVEKPVTLSATSTQRLIQLANFQKTYLATAHVFLFASYIEAFSKIISENARIDSVKVRWVDPKSESRYGESKSYDSGLPIYADWLPHIYSILDCFLTGPAHISKILGFYRGGSDLKINLQYGQTPCVIELVRNGISRQRVIEVTTIQKKIVLDFGFEPGTIYTDDIALCGDSEWDDNPKPVSKMLVSFFQGAVGQGCDERLDNSIGLAASQLINQTALLYNKALMHWLSNALTNYQECFDDDLVYAFSELLQVADCNSTTPIEQRIDYLYSHLKKHCFVSNDEIKQRIDNVIYLVIKKGKISSGGINNEVQHLTI